MNNQNTYRFDLYHIPGAENVRDIGGYSGLDGRPVNKGRFIRAGAMHRLHTDGVKAVRDLGVGCIVDLRSTFEAGKMPDTLMEDEHIAYSHIPMLDYIQSNFVSGNFASFPASMSEMYIGLLDNSKQDFQRLFQVFADSRFHTVLYHCTAGKDRTGLSTMLLLGLGGVSREDIVDDYSHSEKLTVIPAVGKEVPRYLFESAPATMEAALDHLEQRYDGVTAYLDHIGVDGRMREAVLLKLVG